MYAKDLLRYRRVWLGIALVWIILFHCQLDLGPLSYFRAIGYGGVDICIFASGIGCFYSLSSDSDIVGFMKRRIKRLAPTYVVFILFWLAFQYRMGNFGFQMAVGNLLALQDLTGNGNAFNWYISAIFLLYILAPYFKAIAEQASSVRKMIFLIFLLVCSIPFWKADTYIITITRLPIFYIGMLFADKCKKNHQVKKKEIVFGAVALVLGIIILLFLYLFARKYMWSYGLYWYPFVIITPPLCLAISYVSMFLERVRISKPVISVLSLCGDYSFELYLVHILVFQILLVFIDKYDLYNIEYLVWAASIAVIAVGCYVLRSLTAFLSRLFGAIQST